MSHSHAMRTPREHGFWILLILTLGAGFASAPSILSGLTLVLIALMTTLGAALVGRAIRKNPGLQAFASVLIAFTACPVVLAGGGSVEQALRVSLPLSLVFLSGTLCVRAILERARKNLFRSRVAGWGSVLVPAVSGVAFLSLGELWLAAAVAVTALYALSLVLLSPRAKRLRTVGMSISVAHLVTVILLVL